jgi:hypothetical protein
MTTNRYTNIAAMTALTKASLTNNQQVIVGGYTSIGDGGGGTFYWDSIRPRSSYGIADAMRAGTPGHPVSCSSEHRGSKRPMSRNFGAVMGARCQSHNEPSWRT